MFSFCLSAKGVTLPVFAFSPPLKFENSFNHRICETSEKLKTHIILKNGDRRDG